ncbi:MAG: glycosyltransferase [Candidatus Pelagadaptatus aseana]|uniref:glycosyltransferase n=1 Tax=Candidatus Pelagadaptatus aseana TaxID=3120508 RepID=UPI0039B1908F
MKIIHIITDLKDGGAEAVLYRLILSLPQHIHEVVCLGNGGKYVPLLEAEGVKIHILDLQSDIWSVRKMFSIIRKSKPDLIQGWMYHGNFIAALCGFFFRNVDIFWGVHHTNLIPGVDPLLTRLISKACALLSHFIPKAVIYCGDKSKEIHVNEGYSESRAVVVRNGYDTGNFIPDLQLREKVRENLSACESDFLVGSVGRYAPQKDHLNLLNSLSYLVKKGCSVDLLLVGSGLDDSNEELTKNLDDLNLPGAVHLLGRQEDIPSIMNAIDLHVTSSAFGEAFPNVICEAMSCGIPCVTTDVGDAAYIVGDSGWVVPPSSPSDLGDAISLAVEAKRESSLWANRKKAARDRIKNNFGLGIMSEKYLEAWEG